MNDTPDSLRRRRRGRRKGAKDAVPPPEPAVRALIDQALIDQTRQPTTGQADDGLSPGPADDAAAPAADAAPADAPGDSGGVPLSIYDRWRIVGETPTAGGEGADAPPPADAPEAPDATPGGPEDAGDGSAPPGPPTGGPPAQAQPAHHHWVYLAAAVFLAAIGFGLWGVWVAFFADPDADARSVAALRARTEKLSQEVATLRRSDQISRDANRDLERTLAERDEEIAGLRADVAFYERFVGATGQRRGLSVHDLEMRLQGGDAWHFVATLTQNVNRGAVNGGRITLSLEGTRNDRLERLSWSTLRKQNNAPGLPYSFKYFQQVEGEVMLPRGFKPLRVTVRLVPQGGSAVEQSFPWPETVRGGDSG